MSQLLEELLAGDVVELGAQALVAGQDDVVHGQIPGGDVAAGHTGVAQHPHHIQQGVFHNLFNPLGENGLGANYQSCPAWEGLQTEECF